MPNVVISVGDIRQDVILDAVAAELSTRLSNAISGVKSDCAAIARKAIQDSPAWDSLLNGKLKHQLGVVDASPVLDATATAVAQGCQVVSLGCRRSGNSLDGGMRIELVRSDQSEILRQAGNFASENGFDIPWLRWLTLEGDKVLIQEFRFLDAVRNSSRTGQGIMIPSKSRRGWRVPREFAGVAGDNWITKALAGAVPSIAEAVTRRFGS